MYFCSHSTHSRTSGDPETVCSEDQADYSWLGGARGSGWNFRWESGQLPLWPPMRENHQSTKASWGSLRKDTVDSVENDRREFSFTHNIFAFSSIHIAILYIQLNSFIFPFLYFLILNCVQVQKGFGLVEGNSLPSKLHMVTRDTRKMEEGSIQMILAIKLNF